MSNNELANSLADQPTQLTYETVIGCRVIEAVNRLETDDNTIQLAALELELRLRSPLIEAGIDLGYVAPSSLEEMRQVPLRFARDKELPYWQVNTSRQLAGLAMVELQMLDEKTFTNDPAAQIDVGGMLTRLNKAPWSEQPVGAESAMGALATGSELRTGQASATVTAS